jgi:hypothetical protein
MTHAHKHHLPVTINPRPHQRVRIQSPPPITSSSHVVLSPPPITSSSRVVPSPRPGPSQPPIPSFSCAVLRSQLLFIPDEDSDEDGDPSPPSPVTSLPQLHDCLAEYRINQWQNHIQTEKNVLDADTPHIKGPSSDAIAAFLLKALVLLAEETPVPEVDEALEVNASHIDDLNSLFVFSPTFIAYDPFSYRSF